MKRIVLFVSLISILTFALYFAWTDGSGKWTVMAVLSALALIGVVLCLWRPRYAALFAAIEMFTMAGLEGLPAIKATVDSKYFGTAEITVEPSSPMPFVIAGAVLLVFQAFLEVVERNAFKNWRLSFGLGLGGESGSTNMVNSTATSIISQQVRAHNSGQVAAGANIHQVQFNKEVFIEIAPESTPDFNAEIDRAVAYIKERRPDVAIARLEELRRNSFDKLSPREKYRLEANLGHAFNCKDQWVKAGRHFVKASEFQPEDADARGLASIGHFMLGDSATALKLARSVLQTASANEHAFTTLIQCEPVEVSLTDLEKSLPADLKDREAIVFALANRAMSQRDLPSAERYARQLLQQDAGNTQFEFLLGSVISMRAVDGFIGREDISKDVVRQLATESVATLAHVLADESTALISRAHAKYHQGLAHEALEQFDLAEADLRSAVESCPKDSELSYQLCIFLIRHDKHKEAIKHFEQSNCIKDNLAPGIVLSRLLLNRGQNEDRIRATELLEGILASTDGIDERLRFETLELLTRVLVRAGEMDRAMAILHNHRNSLDSCSQYTIEASIALTIGKDTEAVNVASKAYDALSESTPTVARYFLAQILAELKLHEPATELVKSVYEMASVDGTGSFFLRCAWEARDYDFLLRYAEKLRTLGRATPLSRELEISTWELLDEPFEALKLLDEYLDKPDDEEVAAYFRLKKSRLGLRIDKPEIVTFDRSKLPQVPESQSSSRLSVDVLCQTALLLARGPFPQDGAEMAYHIVRRHFESPAAHSCLISIVVLGKCAGITTRDAVTSGTAVEYVSDTQPSPKWVIIEESDASTVRNETASGSNVACQLIGKKVGDKFWLIRDALQERVGTIRTICNKIEYRAKDSIEQWEDRFPEDNFLRKFNFNKPTGELDIEAIIETHRRIDEPLRQLLGLYKKNRLSVGTFAKLSERSVVECVSHLAHDAETPIWCCLGTSDEFAAADAAFSNATAIVIDASALTTLYISGVTDKIDRLPDHIFVTRSSVETFNELLQNPNSRLHAKRSSRFENGRLVIEEKTKEQIDSALDRLSRFLGWVDRNTTTVGGRDLLGLPRSVRVELMELFERSMVESLAVAVARKAVLWSDDCAVAAISEFTRLHPRVWSLLVLSSFNDQKLISKQSFLQFVETLLGFDYRYTRFDQDFVNYAVSRSNWDVGSSALANVIRSLHTSGVDAVGALQLSAYLLQIVWDKAPLAHQKSDVLTAVVRALGRRADAISLLRALRAKITGLVGGLNVAAVRECRSAIQIEESKALRFSPLILPGDPEWPFK